MELENERTNLTFSIRGPIPIQLDENASSLASGASVLDLVFSQSETVSEIRFRNNYSAKVTLQVRYDDSVSFRPKREHLAWASAAKAVTNNLSLFRSLKLSDVGAMNPSHSGFKGENGKYDCHLPLIVEKGFSFLKSNDLKMQYTFQVLEIDENLKLSTAVPTRSSAIPVFFGGSVEKEESVKGLSNSSLITDWVVSVYDKILMPDPHCETGSQDTIVITGSESLVPLHDISALRFILRQPSPNWKQFKIEDISVYKDPVGVSFKHNEFSDKTSFSGCGEDAYRSVSDEAPDLETLRANTALALRAAGSDQESADINDLPEYEILGLQFSF